jgi:hypothetical protein
MDVENLPMVKTLIKDWPCFEYGTWVGLEFSNCTPKYIVLCDCNVNSSRLNINMKSRLFFTKMS